MSLEDSRLRIALTIDRSTKTHWNTDLPPSKKVLKEMFSNGYNNPQWRLEAIEPKTIRARFSHRTGKHYAEYSVSVHIHFTEVEWWIAIVDGHDLGFDGERIHKNALL